jgi:hypothetical protein
MGRRSIFRAGTICVLAVVVIGGYAYLASRSPYVASKPVVTVRPAKSTALARAPVGRWRLARPEALDNAALFFEHILVRYASDSGSREAPFSAANWQSLDAPPTRTHAEALARAREIAERARRAPDEFPALVAEYSEDELTRGTGGSPGALAASQLITEREVLDTLAVLEPGAVSGVIEVASGFLVLRRTSPPPVQEIAARHLVLANDTTPWLTLHRRAGLPAVERTRAQARALAQRIKAEIDALPQPARFDAFAAYIASTSEHRDAEHAGDLGVWSSREPSNVRWQIGSVASLGPGEIAGPIETPFGTELVQRMPVTPRERLGMSSIKMRFDPSAADGPRSLEAVYATAERVLAHVRAQPSRLIDWQREYCCTEAEAWNEGRGDGALSALIKGLRMDAFAERPIVVGHNVVLAKRVAPSPPPPITFEPPSPEGPDIEYVLQNAPAQQASRYVRTLSAAIAVRISLTESQRALIEGAHDALAGRLLVEPSDQRAAALHETQLQLRTRLGDALFDTYMQAVHAEVSRLLLERG